MIDPLWPRTMPWPFRTEPSEPYPIDPDFVLPGDDPEYAAETTRCRKRWACEVMGLPYTSDLLEPGLHPHPDKSKFDRINKARCDLAAAEESLFQERLYHCEAQDQVLLVADAIRVSLDCLQTFAVPGIERAGVVAWLKSAQFPIACLDEDELWLWLRGFDEYRESLTLAIEELNGRTVNLRAAEDAIRTARENLEAVRNELFGSPLERALVLVAACRLPQTKGN